MSTEKPRPRLSRERQAGLWGLGLALALMLLFFWAYHASNTTVRRAIAHCDAHYRQTLIGRGDLAPVRACYLAVLKKRPWQNEVVFKIQSTADLEAERKEPGSGALSALARGDLNACANVGADPALSTAERRSGWEQLCRDVVSGTAP